MGGEPVSITRDVLPGDTYDLQVNLVAPLTPGIYQGSWQMRNGDGVPFGQRIWVGIQVLAPPTPTPPPTQTPAPGINFSADSTRIKVGGCVVFSWGVKNAKAVYFYAPGEPWQQNGAPGHDSRQECPPVTTVYELRVIKSDDSVEIRQIRIEVEPVAGVPTIRQFSVNPDYQAVVGQFIEIQWQVEGKEVRRVRILRNDTDLWDDAPWSGRIQDSTSESGAVTYAIEASGPGGTSRLQRVVNIVEPGTGPTPTVPAATAAPSPPFINGFAVSPNIIQAGECVNLAWRVGGGVALTQLKRDGLIVLDNAPLDGIAQECLGNIGTVVYRLEATNSVGQSVFREEPVSVLEPGSGNPLTGASWQVTSYNNGAGGVVSVLEGTTLTASFSAEGDLNGSAGCNSYSTTYGVSGSTLLTNPPIATRQVCGEPAGIMGQEAAFLAALDSVATFEITGNQLTIRNPGGQTALTAVRP
jgi:heat shock protein HslJ